MIYNARYVLPGLAIFLFLAALPFRFGQDSPPERVKLALPPQDIATECIESRAYMAAAHMDLLYEWRDAATRENKRQYKASDGRIWAVSLTNTCMGCHTDKENFCDACHAAVGAEPTCWDCHSTK